MPESPAVKDTNTNRLSGKTLEAIYESAVDAIITIDEKGIIQSVNPATERLFGYEPVELLGQNVRRLMPDPDREAHDGYLEAYLKTGHARIIGIGRRVVGLKKDGTRLPVHLAVSEIRQGDSRVFAGVVRDLSDLKQVEDQRATLGRIIEDSLNEVYIYDAETLRFITANRGARENIGYSLDELKRLTPIALKPDFTLQTFRDLLKPLVDGQLNTLEFSTQHRRKNGSRYDVEVHLQLTRFDDRPAFVAIILDVTRRYRAEEQLRHQESRMRTELERLVQLRSEELQKAQENLVRSERFATLGKVAGGIAHEIRNPLNAVKMSAWYLLNAPDPPADKIREHLNRIDRQVNLIDNVITALTDVARLPEAELRPCSFPPLLREIVRSVTLPPEISVVFELPDNLPGVLVDRNQIVIAFRNVVRNARDAMKENGGTLTISAEPQNRHVEFAISDTGTGIAPEHLSRVFEPLFTTRARGMGLGLSICRAVVEKHHGEIGVTSEPGKGSRFVIRLLVASDGS